MLNFKYIFAIFSACFIIFCAVFAYGSNIRQNDDVAVYTKKKPIPIDLIVDKKKPARLFVSDFRVISSVLGKIEFFNRKIDGKRSRYFNGPWRGNALGKLSQKEINTYTMVHDDKLTGLKYKIIYRMMDSNELKITLNFITPLKTKNVSFEILSLDSDIFKGSPIRTHPVFLGDIKSLPLKPVTFKNRKLLKNKNKAILYGKICDVEVEDINLSKSINIADFRNVKWAENKGYYLYATITNLIPDKEYVYEYSVKFYRPSFIKASHSNADNPHDIILNLTDNLLKIAPKSEIRFNEDIYLDSIETIYGQPDTSETTILKDEILDRYGFSYSVKKPVLDQSEKGIHLVLVPNTEKNLGSKHKDAFEIIAKDGSILIQSKTQRGLLYAVYNILDRIQNKHGRIILPGCHLKDWPDLNVRGMAIECSMPVRKDIHLFKRYLKVLSKARANLILFYHNPSNINKWKNDESSAYWTKNQMTEVADYARYLHMDIWAGMKHKFKKESFPQLAIKKGTNFYNPFSEKSYDFLYSLYEQLIEVYRPKILLIGHDEIKGLNKYSKNQKISTADIFLNDVSKITRELNKKDITTAIWGDMLLDHKTVAHDFSPANSQNGMLNSGPTHESLTKLPKNIIILDWHYDFKDNYHSLKFFKNYGFTVLGATNHMPSAALSMARSIKNNSCDGIIGTDWGFWRTLNPNATTLYTMICSWNADVKIDNVSDALTLQSNLTDMPTKSWLTHTPIRLEPLFNETTWDNGYGNNSGIFDVGSYLDLRNLLPGKNSFNGVAFEFVDPQKGRIQNCFVLSRSSNSLKTTTNILPLNNKKFNAIAFLHTMFSKEPGYKHRLIGNYIIEYADNQTIELDIIEGWNITDVRSAQGLRKNNWSFSRNPELLVGSKVGWTGISADGVPLNLQQFVWENPFSSKAIKEIRFEFNNSLASTKFIVLAITGLTKELYKTK